VNLNSEEQEINETEQTWIVSGQSAHQQQLIAIHDGKTALRLEGVFFFLSNFVHFYYLQVHT
jgi:hypothetical protein